MTKIDKYLFAEILKGALLVFFIFLSISWLLQFTRLISLTNLIQVDIITILYLSIFLIPNLMTVIIPFVIIFGLIITFIKLYRDKELVSILTLGLGINSIKKSLFYFSLINLIILIALNFFLSPKVYKNYKILEHEIRNKINFEKINTSNFIEINKNTFLDFKKNKQKFQEVFIQYNDGRTNLIFAKNANIFEKKNKINFNLINGFKITLLDNNKIEKLEFDNYTLEITNNSFNNYNNFDNNTFDILEDISNQNYENIFYKFLDSIIVIFIIILFYLNNIKKYQFNLHNILFFTFISCSILVLNQILKNINFNIYIYFLFFIILIFIFLTSLFIGKNNVKN